MKKFLLLLLSVVISGQLAYSRDVLHTKNTTIVLDAEVGKDLQIVYYGARLSDTDVANLRFAGSVLRGHIRHMDLSARKRKR